MTSSLFTQFHFAGIQSVWTRRALIAAGFGTGTPASGLPVESGPQITPYHGVATLGARDRAGPSDEEEAIKFKQKDDNLRTLADSDTGSFLSSDTPFFHVDLFAAVHAAESLVGRGN